MAEEVERLSRLSSSNELDPFPGVQPLMGALSLIVYGLVVLCESLTTMGARLEAIASLHPNAESAALRGAGRAGSKAPEATVQVVISNAS